MDRHSSVNNIDAGGDDAGETYLGSLQQSWELLGDEDPLWAILSVPEKKGGGWDVEEFFRTGEREIAEIFQYLAQRSLTPKTTRALDFGCGVGRVSQALARRFERVVGIDVSSTMVSKARSINAEYSNLVFHHVPAATFPLAD